MKIIAAILIVLGAVCLFLGAFWETTPHGYVNFHAVSEQQKLLMLGGFTFLGGLVMLGFERMRPRSPDSVKGAGGTAESAQSTIPEQPYPNSAEPLPGVKVPEVLQRLSKTPSPDFRLRLAVACGIGFPIAFFSYQSGYLYESSFASIAVISIAIAYSMIPGSTASRLKQMFWIGTALCVVLLIDQIDFIMYLAREEVHYADEFGALSLIVVLGAGYLICSRFVGRWVARLQTKEINARSG